MAPGKAVVNVTAFMPLMVVSKPPWMVSIEVAPPPGGVLPLRINVGPGPPGDGELELNISVMFRMAVLGTKPAKTMDVGQRRSSRCSSSSRAVCFFGLCWRSFLDTNFEKLRMTGLSTVGRGDRFS